jgi:hypothetical protein
LQFEADGKPKTLTRRDLLKLTGAVPIGLALSGCSVASQESGAEEQPGSEPRHLYTKDKVPDPENVTFLVQSGKAPTKLVGHY